MVVFVNQQKLERAQHIIGLLTGKTRARDAYERERMDHYSLVLQGVDHKSPEAVEIVYKTLGGLTRTEEEHKAHETKVEEMKKEGRKNKLGFKKDL